VGSEVVGKGRFRKKKVNLKRIKGERLVGRNVTSGLKRKLQCHQG